LRAAARICRSQRSKAIKMMIGIGTPSSHNSIPRPIFSHLVKSGLAETSLSSLVA
jgi:hypothetical protein